MFVLLYVTVYTSSDTPTLAYQKSLTKGQYKTTYDYGLNVRNDDVSNVQKILSNNSTTLSTSITLHQSRKQNQVYFSRVAFLKTHKTGSSTAQNIFLRYGQSRNSTFLLSRVREDQWDNVISTLHTLNDDNTLPPPVNKTYDIMCCHVLYDYEAFRRYMPDDTVFIGIVREPFEHFLSTLNYFRPTFINGPIEQVKQNTIKYLKNPYYYENGISPYYSFTNNRMALEFGFPIHLFRNYSAAESRSYLEKIDKEFKFVIIMDYFIESVVMMRRLLGWSIKDVLYVKLNAAKREEKIADYTNRYLYQNFAKLDYDLYDFFFKRLWKQIHDEGPDYFAELLYFRRLRQNVDDFCRFSKTGFGYYPVAVSQWGSDFNVTATDCRYLTMNEIEFISIIRKRQYG